MGNIVLNEIDKVYDNGFHAVHKLSLDVADGEFLVLVGPSGCGKSTALRMIAGLETITSGELRIGDKVVNDLEPKDRDIAMVFQSYALYPHLTVRDNIAFALKLKKMPKDEINERVDKAARILELTENLDRKPGQLSGGQRQRVAMGRAIVRQPQAFLMDEPLSNLDAKLRVQMRAEVSKLQHTLNVTTVYVTHDQIEAMTMGDRVAVLSRGVPAAGRHAAEPLRPPRQPVRRGLHRLAADEPARGHRVEQRRRHDVEVRQQHPHRAGVGAGDGPVARRLRREAGRRRDPSRAPDRRRRRRARHDQRRQSTSEKGSAPRSSST